MAGDKGRDTIVANFDRLSNHGAMNKKEEGMIVRINHSGYLVMDTCCFGNYCKTEEERNKDKGIRFNYKGIEEYVEEKNILPVITPYTLYECIQNCDTADEMLRQLKAFIEAGRFFVINVNKIFDHSIIYGPTIVSEFAFDYKNP